MIYTLGIIASSIRKIVGGGGGGPVAFVMDAYTSVLLHLNDTGFVDEAGHTFTVGGTVGIVADASSTGGYEANFTGAGELTTPASADLTFGTGAWTIEYSITTTSSASPYYHVSLYDSDGFAIYTYNGDFYIYSNTGASPSVTASTINVCDGVRHAIKVSYDGTTVKIFVDGVLYKSQATSYNFSVARPLAIGGLASGSPVAGKIVCSRRCADARAVLSQQSQSQPASPRRDRH